MIPSRGTGLRDLRRSIRNFLSAFPAQTVNLQFMTPRPEAMTIDHLSLESLDIRSLELDYDAATFADQVIMMFPVNDLLVSFTSFSEIVLSNDLARDHQTEGSIDGSHTDPDPPSAEFRCKIIGGEVFIDQISHLDDRFPLSRPREVPRSEIPLDPVNGTVPLSRDFRDALQWQFFSLFSMMIRQSGPAIPAPNMPVWCSPTAC